MFMPVNPVTLQYLVGSAVALIISILVARENFKDPSYYSFFFFGLCISIWEIFAFMHRNAPNPFLSDLFLRIDFILTILAQQFLLLTILSLRTWKKHYFLLIIPIVPCIIFFYDLQIELYATAYGWSYKIIGGTIAGGKLGQTIFYIFIIAVISVTIYLIIRNPPLRKKLSPILAGYLIYVIVIIVVNLIIFPRNPQFPPLGGIVSLIMFLFIAYAVRIKIPLKTLESPQPSEILLSLKYFLDGIIKEIPGEALGKKIFEIKSFLNESHLDTIVKIENNKLVILEQVLKVLKGSELSSIASNVIASLEAKDWGSGVIQHFLGFVNKIYGKYLNENARMAFSWLEYLINRHGDFLRKTDVLYGLANGEALNLIEKDESLLDEVKWKAIFRLYKRILFATIQDFYRLLGESIAEKALTYDLLRFVDFSGLKVDSLFSTKELEKVLSSMDESERIRRLKDSFNTFMIWLFDNSSKFPEVESIVKKVRRVLYLNPIVARRLNVLHELSEILAPVLPREVSKVFKIADGFSEKDASRFSNRIGIEPEQLPENKVLFEFDPKTAYERVVEDFITENLAHYRECYVLTRKNSRIYKIASKNLEHVFFYFPRLLQK